MIPQLKIQDVTVTVDSFWNNNYIEFESNMVGIKRYQLENIFIKAGHT